jgi:hypothetical protein
MREESQLEEMRAALRGDRERAEQSRQRSHENVRALIDEPERRAQTAPEPLHEPRHGGLRSLFRRR